MSAITPASRPQLTQAELRHLIRHHHLTDAVVVIGIRGYYLDTMGSPGINDRRLYDDALFIIGPQHFSTYNANVDPAAWRKGHGHGVKRGMASLKPGVWRYQPGPHPLRDGYPAFRQAAPVTVIRDGDPDYEDTGDFGINIHRGGHTTTSSAGCQTLPPAQWNAFQTTLMDQLKRAGQKTFPYVLI